MPRAEGGLKQCGKCGEVKPVSEYHPSPRYRDGLGSYCKPCQSLVSLGWYYRNRQHCAKVHRLWYEENADKALETSRKYRDANPEKRYLLGREWTEKHREKTREYANNRRALKMSRGIITAEEWQDVLVSFGNRCLCCGATDNLSMDHVKPLSIGGTNTIDNVQPLCKSCNSRKHVQEIDYRTRYEPAGETITVEGEASPL